MDQGVATALNRVVSILERRPGAGLHDDAPAMSRWSGRLGVTTSHPNGTRIDSDMPKEYGGEGIAVSPGWLMRAGLSACTATCIAMLAARQGVELMTLDVRASSRSDARGLFGMTQADNERVSPGPQDLQLHIRLAARNASESRLRALVAEALNRSPVSTALREPTHVQVQIEEGTV